MRSRRVSVLVPSFDRARTLPRVLRSIFAQTHEPSEVIVVDDGSTDPTAAVLGELREQHPEWGDRLTVLTQPNSGKSVALNRALARATGDWIAFDDADDIWAQDKLEAQFAALARHPNCGACVTDTAFGSTAADEPSTFLRAGLALQGDEGLLADASLTMARASHGVMMQTLLIDAEVARRVGPFDPSLRAGQDIDYLFRVSRETPICFVRRALVVLDRSPDPDRLTRRFPMGSVARLELHERMVLGWLAAVQPEEGALAAAVRARLRATRSALANRLLLDGRPGEARATLRRALAEEFTLPLAVKLIVSGVAPGVARRWIESRARGRQSGG